MKIAVDTFPFNKDKIGNLLVYITSELRPVYHTKLLKLLYLIDKTSVEKVGSPITWLNYKAWRLGPVATPIYDLKFNNSLFQNYIDVIHDGNGTRIEPITDFDDDDFSDYELELINQVLKSYGHLPSERLIELTHEENSPWYLVVKKHDLMTRFDEDDTGVSPYDVDLSVLISHDKEKLSIFNETLHNRAIMTGCCKEELMV
jgi:uncharacterized phage-associated protein